MEYTHKFCCESLNLLNYDNDADFWFEIVKDVSYDILTQKWTTKAEPFPAICYREPQWYGETSLEQQRINNCPFCGKKIEIIKKTKGVNG